MDKDTGIAYYLLFSLLNGEVDNQLELENKINEYIIFIYLLQNRAYIRNNVFLTAFGIHVYQTLLNRTFPVY